jgi:acyl-CoA thioester hydrolase
MTEQPAARPESTLRRAQFSVIRSIPTRWADVDTYSHVNNAVHYEMMDTAVNGWLVESTGTDIRELDAVGWVIETSCVYLAQLHFPEVVDIGLSLERIGRTSIVYRLALFATEPTPIAVGRFVHVYVGRVDHRPAPIPDIIRASLDTLRPYPLA